MLPIYGWGNKESITKALNTFSIKNEIIRELPYNNCGYADYCEELPQKIETKNLRGSAMILKKVKPWGILSNLSMYVPICIWYHEGRWSLDTDCLHFSRFGNVERFGAEYTLSWEKARTLTLEFEKSLSFAQIPFLEEDLWNEFRKNSK